MLVDDNEALSDLFRIQGKPILIHSEDEGIIKANLEAAKAKFGEDIPFSEHPRIRNRKACIRSTAKALAMAVEYGTRLHVLHVSTAEEVEMIRAAKIHNPNITAETSANYLWFCDEDYEKLNGKVKCNPAIKSASDREALRKGLAEGIIDTIGSDHAPHLLSEKVDNYLKCPSGMPSVQQSLSALLTAAALYNEGKNADEDALISLSRIASSFSEKPAEILGIKDRGHLKVGNYADLVILDPEQEYSVKSHADLVRNVPEQEYSIKSHTNLAGNAPEQEYSVKTVAYKCGWSPYEGTTLRGVIDRVFLNGKQVVTDSRLLPDSPSGPALAFTHQ